MPTFGPDDNFTVAGLSAIEGSTFGIKLGARARKRRLAEINRHLRQLVKLDNLCTVDFTIVRQLAAERQQLMRQKRMDYEKKMAKQMRRQGPFQGVITSNSRVLLLTTDYGYSNLGTKITHQGAAGAKARNR